MLKKWLEASYMENRTLYSTHRGTPQGGLISACLLVNVLAGLEAAIKAVIQQTDKVNVCVYADGFVITGATQEVLEDKVKPAVQAFLTKRGLQLSATKTKITHIDQGFDFLGFNIRKYKSKLLIKPSKASVQQFLSNTQELIRKSTVLTTDGLIRILNLRIQGWCNYYRHGVAKKTFTKIDHCIFKALLRWARRRHPEKGARWQINKYFRRRDNRQWIFHAKVPTKDGTVRMLDLIHAGQIPIIRHVKIRSDATPYDPVFAEYFKKRHAQRLVKVKAKGLLGQLDENGLRMARAV